MDIRRLSNGDFVIKVADGLEVGFSEENAEEIAQFILTEFTKEDIGEQIVDTTTKEIE